MSKGVYSKRIPLIEDLEVEIRTLGGMGNLSFYKGGAVLTKTEMMSRYDAETLFHHLEEMEPVDILEPRGG